MSHDDMYTHILLCHIYRNDFMVYMSQFHMLCRVLVNSLKLTSYQYLISVYP